MGYVKQGFVDNDKTKPLTAAQLIAMEDAIIALEKNLPINYALPYTSWNWKEGLEGSDIQKDKITLTNTSGTSGVFGHIYTLSNTEFSVGQTLYFGVRDLVKDGGNLSIVFLNGSTEISRVNATVTSPITYIEATIPENTTIMQIRFHGSSWTSISAGKFYISTIEFDENTVFNTYTPSSSTNSNGTENEVYVSTTGDDGNDGTITNPLKTISAALKKSNRVTIMGGIYSGETIDVASYNYPSMYIRGVETQPVILNFGTNILVNDGSETLVDGYTKVYQVACSKPYSDGAYTYRIYQDYVADTSTYIEDADRHALQRGREYRCDSTIIKQIYNSSASPFFDTLATALAKIEALPENSYGFYWYDGVMYFSRPETSSAAHPIVMPKRDARFINQAMGRSRRNQCRVVLNNIEVRYANVHFSYASNNECADVLVKYPYVSNGGGFYIYEASNCRLIRCETCSVTNGTSTGDGFNVDTQGNTNSDDDALCCSVFLDECWSHDHNDDGYSDHDRSEVYIRGGLYEYCGKGGLTPAYGSNDVIENAICRYNKGAGILATGAPTSPVTRKFTTVNAISCLCYGQAYGFRTTSGCMLHAVNCVAYGNTTADFEATAGNIYVYGCKSGSGTAKVGNVTTTALNDI